MLEITQVKTPSYALLSYIIHDPLSRECLVVDPSGNIKTYINASTMSIKEVINTHLHPDHTTGNHLFAGKVPIRAHSGDNSFGLRTINFVLSAAYTARIPPKIQFDLEDNTAITLGNTTITVMHTPGHSPDSICLYWPGNLISGDTVFAGNIGRTDIPGGNLKKLKQSILKILDLPDQTVLWPGHYYMERYSSTLSQERSFLNQVVEKMR